VCTINAQRVKMCRWVYFLLSRGKRQGNKLVFSDVIWKQILEIDVNKYYRFKDSQEPIDMDSLYTTRKPINQLWGKMIPVDRLKCFMEKHREFTSNTVVFNG